jgi:hypothetical protein
LKEKLSKTTLFTKLLALFTKPLIPLKPMTTKLPAPFSPTLKKPSLASPKSNVKYTPVNHSKEALTLKSPSYIKFNQIQIEKIESKNFNTPTLRQGDNMQREIIEINKLKVNTPSLRPNEIQITFPTPKLLPQTVFIASEPLPLALPTDSLLIKRKHLGLSKHKTNIDNTSTFTFNKPSSTDSPEYKDIEKPKKVIKKNKFLNKNTEILEFLFDQKLDNNNNNNNNNNSKTNKSNNSKDIFDPKNMEYSTSTKTLPQILVLDSQIIIPSLAPFSHSSPYIASPSSPPIHSLIVDSNALTQASNSSETFELIPTPPLPHVPNPNRETIQF